MRETVGSFMLIRNEIAWVRAHILRHLPYIDEMVFFDGNSTDGTLETMKDIQSAHPCGRRLRIVEDMDPKDLKDDYVRLFNQALQSLNTDWAFFLHPDMFVENPEVIVDFMEHSHNFIAASTRMRSFAGEPDGPLLEIVNGRVDRWKNLYRLRNPDLGAHYDGWYGLPDEDVYFRAITGDQHKHHAQDLHNYPYVVADSGINILHFSDVRPYARRLGRMKTCYINGGHSEKAAHEHSVDHPRVTLKGDAYFRFKAAEYPDYVIQHQEATPA